MMFIMTISTNEDEKNCVDISVPYARERSAYSYNVMSLTRTYCWLSSRISSCQSHRQRAV